MTLVSTWWGARVRSWMVAAAAVLLAAACGGGGDDRPRAQLADGTVIGVKSEATGMRSFFAIPFAAPPVGERRWRAPAAPTPWSVPRMATRSAPPCLQTGSSPFRLSGDSEDCLYLDVHAPPGPGPFPVMVWFHGGAFSTGGAETYADPSPLVGKGVIVVNAAYRMGAMGFLGHAALEHDGLTGNWGIMDQQRALAWVRDNIAAFGGDRGNVTIFGESAGGFSVMTHLASPGSAGLFHKAIVMSGNYAHDSQPSLATLRAASNTIVNNTLSAAGIACAGGSVTGACLRALPESVVRTQLAQAFGAVFSSPVPAVDGAVLPKSVKQTFIDGGNRRVPVLIGTTRDEWALFVAIRELSLPPLAADGYTAYLQTSLGLGATAAAIASIYPPAAYGGNASLAASAVGADLVFACNAWRAAQRLAGQASGQPLWFYEFRDRSAPPSIAGRSDGTPISFAQGAAHSYELQYLFNLRALPTAEQRALQAAMSGYWANFARSGDPNAGGASVPAAWPAYGSSGAVLGLDVASTGGVAPLAASYGSAHRCDSVWTTLTF